LACIAQKSLGIYFQPTLNFTNTDQSAFNFSAGVKSQIVLNKKLSLNAGLGYANDHCNPLYVLFRSADQEWPNFYDARMIKANCHLRIKLTKRYRKLSFYAFAGPTMNTSFYEKTDIGRSATIRIHDVFATAGFEGNLKIKKVAIIVAPTFETRIWQNSSNLASDYRNHCGVEFGLIYYFKKITTGCNCD